MAYVYFIYVSLWVPIKARVQNGVSGSYMDAIFEFVMPKESEVSDLYAHVVQSHT